MVITGEMIDAGTVRVRETDFAAIGAIREYNSGAMNSAGSMKHVSEMSFALKFINALVIPALCFACRGEVFSRLPLALALLGVVAAAYGLMLWKKAFLPFAAVSALLILLDARFAILFALNLLLAVMREILDRKLRQMPDYPRFRKIELILDSEPETDRA